MWWLCGADAFLPFGDIAYLGGVLITGIGALSVTENSIAQRVLLEEKEKVEAELPDVTYPGDDPTKGPEGTEWKGKGPQGSKQGNYYDSNTGESWHPDLDHPDPIGSHWDYNYKGSGVDGWRIYPDGTAVPKFGKQGHRPQYSNGRDLQRRQGHYLQEW